MSDSMHDQLVAQLDELICGVMGLTGDQHTMTLTLKQTDCHTSEHASSLPALLLEPFEVPAAYFEPRQCQHGSPMKEDEQGYNPQHGKAAHGAKNNPHDVSCAEVLPGMMGSRVSSLFTTCCCCSCTHQPVSSHRNASASCT